MDVSLSAICDSVKESLGYPASLMRLLEARPDIYVSLEETAHCIDASSVVSWHDLGNPYATSWPQGHRHRGCLMGWKNFPGNDYRSFHLTRPEYAEIVQCKTIRDWKCDITDVYGFSNSRSDLGKFSSTDAMVERDSREMIDSISQEKLTENLSHGGIKIIHNPDTTDHFVRYLWDGNLFLINNDGSHHFAAAKYIAARLPKAVPLRGKLRIYSINPAALASLCMDFEMFVVYDKADISCAFHDAMAAFRAAWLWHPMPRPYDDDTRAILLPKNEPRSRFVAGALRQAGIADLGVHLTKLIARQTEIGEGV